MTDTGVKYKTMTVQVLRGTESRAVRKWEAAGWELVSQTPATLRTELVFRRPKPTVQWRYWAIGGAMVAVVLAVVIPIGIINGRGAEPHQATGTSLSASAPTPTEPTSTASTTEAPAPASTDPSDVVLTAQNSPELAAILELGDNCNPTIATFAAEHVGDTIGFPGNIADLASHDGATTRYDILISPGDFSTTSARGPTFQFRDVNAFDLRFADNPPESVSEGTNLIVTAEVGEYNDTQCLFQLKPVSTAVR